MSDSDIEHVTDAATAAVPELPLHADFQKARFTKPVKQMIVFVALMLFGVALKSAQHDYSYAGFFAVMILAASGPFIYLYTSSEKELRQWGREATRVFEQAEAARAKIVLFEIAENRLTVLDAKITTDDKSDRTIVSRVMLKVGKKMPALAEEVPGLVKLDLEAKIAIVDIEGYRMWCKVAEVNDT